MSESRLGGKSMAEGRAVYWAPAAWIGGPGVAAEVTIEVADGTIVGVGVGSARPAAATVLDGLVLPGLANAHSHAFHRLLRSRTQGDGGTFWTWRDVMYREAAALDPGRMRAVARAVYAEMVLAGYAVVGEFHYVHHRPDGTPYDDPNALGLAIVEGARDAGIRLTLLDTCYLHGGLDEGGHVPPTGPQMRFSDGDAATWARRVDRLGDGPMVRIGAAIHSVRAVDPAAAGEVAAWARARGAPLHAHVSEQPEENRRCMAIYGTTPLGVLAGAGALDDRFTAVHATHPGDGDVARLADAGASVCLCPTTEQDLADGIGPGGAFAAAGVRLCLGSDSHAVVDPFGEMRAAEMHERLATGRRGTHPPDRLLEMATSGGYEALGWPGGGRIEVGAPADLVAIATDSVRTAGAGEEGLTAAAAFAATAADVRTVVVGGSVVVEGGRHRAVDPAAEVARLSG